MMLDVLYTVDVSWTGRRPVVPDEYTSRVQLLAPHRLEAELVAHEMLAGRRGVVMVTRVKTVGWDPHPGFWRDEA